MKILLLGKDGQVGWELQRTLAPLGDLISCGREEADLEDWQGLSDTLRRIRPEVIVNAAAYTQVDQAELEPQRAQLVNADAAGLLAKESRRLGAWLLHYSTDYVFDGQKSGPYQEDDPTNPLNVYGSSKLDGEKAIVAGNRQHIIFRVSWVYSTRRNNFLKTMLRLGQSRDSLRVISDCIGAPTSASLIADVTALCLDRLLKDNQLSESGSGIYHLAPGGQTSWHGFAREIMGQASAHGGKGFLAPDRVSPILTEEYPQRARRPLNSLLDTEKIRTTFNLDLPAWQVHVERAVSQMFKQGLTWNEKA
ncbi:MAG: dTDP-4-dehydrorhamnose reductase [Desulfarculaceae bacterium]|nr:dTDP-4-dehydrorhamnose reductase [Desulfarculaceae bacterium]MCF8072096.1 dTDP-4-dehydrorhamnose reductase [Desulfarculaceae bacterium]MCF8100017.1 dTDP-4-dehydrorhamnose reductase [Desulfarculaceae bacterium]